MKQGMQLQIFFKRLAAQLVLDLRDRLEQMVIVIGLQHAACDREYKNTENAVRENMPRKTAAMDNVVCHRIDEHPRNERHDDTSRLGKRDQKKQKNDRPFPILEK